MFFNTGKYVDATQQPAKCDLIACLGGGSHERIKKSVWLYKEGYSNENIIILTGSNDKNIAYARKYAPKLELVKNSKPKNTAEEVRFIKKYMAECHYKSVIIVSAPPHTRRIRILTDLISVKGDEKFSYILIDNNASWWHHDKYYQNRTAFRFTLSEILKIPYTYLYYGVFEKLGIKWDETEYQTLRKRFQVFKKELLLIVEKI